MSTAYIGIGSNLGNRRAQCQQAIRRLHAAGCTILKISSLIETTPWGLTNQPRFLNCVVCIETSHTAHELLHLLLSIETAMGRVRIQPWGPRCIDLDLLLYDSLIIQNSDLIVPHPFMHQRTFVLGPLSEIAPDAVHPIFQKTISELFQEIQS